MAVNDEYDDLTPMPFGQEHRGKPLQDVPAGYLHWYYTKTERRDAKLNRYIEKNLDALRKEHPDGIWR
jgi:uncharacterized protein (DUF3820 family)